jgi:hypothetical protein
MSPRQWARGAAVIVTLAVTALAAGGPAASADLSYEPYEHKYGSPYDDPRYADIYRHPPPRRDTYRDGDTYGHRYDPRARDDDEDDDDQPYRSSGRGRDDYLPPMREVPRFAEADRYRGDRCVPRHEVKHRLRSEGWSDFHDLELRGDIAFVRARRPSGRLFELKIDRCSGDIVKARPYGPHAYGLRRYPSRS